jgi:hypothetical protein
MYQKTNQFNKLLFYIVQAVLVFLMVKAISNDAIPNIQIVILSAIIVAITYLFDVNTTCPYAATTVRPRSSMEYFDPTRSAIIDSVYQAPPQSKSAKLLKYDDAFGQQVQRVIPPETPAPKIEYSIDDDNYPDPDITDLKDNMQVDKKLISQLNDREQKARQIIRSKYKDEMQYTNTHEFNTIPLGSQIYSYTYLPPENWFRAYERPPVCISNDTCPVCPVVVNGNSTAELMEFDTMANQKMPMGIDVNYVQQKLNQNVVNRSATIPNPFSKLVKVPNTGGQKK